MQNRKLYPNSKLLFPKLIKSKRENLTLFFIILEEKTNYFMDAIKKSKKFY